MSIEIGGSYTNYTAGANAISKAAQAKTNGYYEQLRDRFDCVKEGKISISPVYLRSCADDPEKAKELEENLSFFNESVEDGRKNAKAYLSSLGDELVSYSESWEIDAKGNVTMAAQVSGKTGGGAKDVKDQKAELEKRLAEKREKKRLEAKKAEQRAKEEKIRVKQGRLDARV